MAEAAAGSQHLISRAGVQIGEDFEGEGAIYFNASININSASADEVIQKVKELTNNTFDASWKVVIAFSVSPDKKGKFLEAVNKLKTEKPTNDEGMRTFIYDGVSSNKISIDTYEGEGKVFLSISLIEGLEDIQGAFQSFFEMGEFNKLAESQKNSIQFSFGSNNPIDKVLEQLQEGESIISAILTSARFVLDLSLDKDFGTKLKDSAAGIDPEIANSPPLVFLRYFKGLDVDIRFTSAQELPDDIRKKYLAIKTFQKPPEQLKVPEEEARFWLVNTLIDTLDADTDIYFAVPGFVGLQVSAHLPALGKFFKTYGRILADRGFI